MLSDQFSFGCTSFKIGQGGEKIQTRNVKESSARIRGSAAIVGCPASERNCTLQLIFYCNSSVSPLETLPARKRTDTRLYVGHLTQGSSQTEHTSESPTTNTQPPLSPPPPPPGGGGLARGHRFCRMPLI